MEMVILISNMKSRGNAGKATTGAHHPKVWEALLYTIQLNEF